MSSRSNGVTNVPVEQVDHLVREAVALVLELADVAQLVPARRASPRAARRARRAMSRAFAEACVNRSKNSRFCGRRLRPIASAPGPAAPDAARAADRSRARTIRTRNAITGRPSRTTRTAAIVPIRAPVSTSSGIVLADDHTPDPDQRGEHEERGADDRVDQEDRHCDRERRARVVARERRVGLARPPDVRDVVRLIRPVAMPRRRDDLVDEQRHGCSRERRRGGDLPLRVAPGRAKSQSANAATAIAIVPYVSMNRKRLPSQLWCATNVLIEW